MFEGHVQAGQIRILSHELSEFGEKIVRPELCADFWRLPEGALTEYGAILFVAGCWVEAILVPHVRPWLLANPVFLIFELVMFEEDIEGLGIDLMVAAEDLISVLAVFWPGRCRARRWPCPSCQAKIPECRQGQGFPHIEGAW